MNESSAAEPRPPNYRRIRRYAILLMVLAFAGVLTIAYQRFRAELDLARHHAEWSLWRSDHCTVSAAAGLPPNTPSAYMGAHMRGKPGTWRCGRTTYTLRNSDVPPAGWRLPPEARLEYYGEP